MCMHSMPLNCEMLVFKLAVSVAAPVFDCVQSPVEQGRLASWRKYQNCRQARSSQPHWQNACKQHQGTSSSAVACLTVCAIMAAKQAEGLVPKLKSWIYSPTGPTTTHFWVMGTSQITMAVFYKSLCRLSGWSAYP